MSELKSYTNHVRLLRVACITITGLAPILTQAKAGSATPAMSSSLPSDEEIHQILVDRIDVQHKSIGMVVGIVTSQGRRVISYGHLDKGDPRPVDGNTVFEIGSVTKVFTSLLLTDAVQRGEVALTDPVEKYLPAGVKLKQWKGRSITLVDLATHTSGLPFWPLNFPAVEDTAAYGKYTVEQLYQFLSTYELPREPGTQWEYSNTDVGLLGLVLNQREGMDYESLVKARITGPLGMKSTAITISPQMKARLAIGHDGQLEPSPAWEVPTLAGAGSLRSSANDLLILLANFSGNADSLLRPAMTTMLKTRRPNQLYFLDQVIGWWVIGKGEDEFFIHGGGTLGFSSSIGYDPKMRIGVVVLSNATPSVDDIVRHLLRPNMPLDKPQMQKIRKEIAVDARLLDLYAGQYRPSPEWVYTVTHEGDALRIQLPAAPKMRLYAETERDFFLKTTDAQVTFQMDDNGCVTGLILHIWGFDVPATRIEPGARPLESGASIQ